MKKLLLLAAVFVTATFTAQAGDRFGKWAAPFEPLTPRTLKAAEECHVGGGSVALVCTDCKSVNKAADKDTLAKMFKDGETHQCSGCKGVITVKSSKAGRDHTTEYTHECSKCAKNSTTCAMHPKKADKK